MSKRAMALALIALFGLSSVSRTHAHSHLQKSPHKSIEITKNLIAAAHDLDVDIRPERLTVDANDYDKTITIRFGDARNSQISFTARTDFSGNLVARDIDHDGDVDLVWVGTADRQNAVVLINNGEGNFAEASDSSAYASELDGLFGGIDPSGNLKLTRGRKSSTLTSTSFHEIGLPLSTRFQSIPLSRPVVSIEPLVGQSLFVCNVRKRGPPTVLS